MIAASHLFKPLNPSAMDQILLHLALTSLRSQSYRHGAFLDAAATAAKCAVYVTYLEQGKNLRVTGQLHHIEAKRVKAIVEEIQQALTEGGLMKLLSSLEPRYLLQFPYLWLARHPWQTGQLRVASTYLTRQEKSQIEAQLPLQIPAAQVISKIQFQDLVGELYEGSQSDLAINRQLPLSEAMADHIERCLLHAGTIAKLDIQAGIPFYALLRATYSPVAQAERTATMVEDTARYCDLMQKWVDRQPGFLRMMEELDILPEQLDQATAELDQLLRQWADRYHHNQGVPFVLQMACGLDPTAATSPN